LADLLDGPEASREGGYMRFLVCEEERMLRSLHGRWPYRRSHCRHDLHWLLRVRPRQRRCMAGRVHQLACLPAQRRRPYAG